MIKYSLLVRLEAKPGKEQAVAEFLAARLAMVNEEAATPIWFSLRSSPTTFGVFVAFETEQDRQAHLQGPIAQALMAHAGELLAKAPTIESVEVLGLKNRLAAR
jgi:quinol monooxygenase YgiN